MMTFKDFINQSILDTLDNPAVSLTQITITLLLTTVIALYLFVAYRVLTRKTLYSKPFEENIALTRKVVEYAHDHGAVVEAELGTLAGVEDDVVVEHGAEMFTRPEEVEEFVSKTGCDSLAIAIGTSHGAYKFKPGTKPQLRFDVLEECAKRLPGFPIVLHGASSVPQNFVEEINAYGGNMPGAIGIPEEQLAQAAKLAVCKINIDSDIRLAMTASVRKYLAEHPDHFDPRQWLKPARQAVKDMVTHKIVNVLGCNGKA